MKLFVAANFVMACCWKLPRLPACGETLQASDLSMEPGGKGLNVAIAARRLGVEVQALIGVGADAAGQQLLELLHAEHIGADFVHRFGTPSGYGAGLIGADGQNMIAVYPGANERLQAHHADPAQSAIAGSDAVYGQFETSIEAVQRCFEIAREHGKPTVLNPSPWRSIPAALLKLCSVLIVNELEAESLLGCAHALRGGASACRAAVSSHLEALWTAWPGELLIVTLGERGSMACRRGQDIVMVAAFAVDAVDTVGAGDAFAAGMLTRLFDGDDLSSTLAYANACGAIVASQRGVLDALPRAAQVQRFLAERSS